MSSQDIIVPPVPPTPQEEIRVKHIDVGNGEFNYISDKQSRLMLQYGWKAVTLTENWNFLRKHVGPYIFSNTPEIKIIYNKIEELGYYGHSGSSFMLTLRNLETLARIGEDEFKNGWNKE